MLLNQLQQDGSSIYTMSPDGVDGKVMETFTEMKIPVGARRWDPALTPNPSFMVMLYSDGGNVEGDLAIIPNGRIGGGTYGSVYKAVVLDRNKQTIKVIVKLTNKPFSSPPKDYINEVLTMWDNSSDPRCEIYATCLYGVFKSRFGSADPRNFYYGIVMEEMDGNLMHLCRSIGANPQNTDESKLYFLIYCGLHMIYDVWRLHERGYFHNDIKPTNFLYKRMDNGQYRIKLADFGLSCSVKTNQLEQRLVNYKESHKVNVTPELYASYLPCHVIGTPEYMSETMKMYQKYHGMREEITKPSLYIENDIHGIVVSLKQIALWLNLTESNTDFRVYDDTPVSRALFVERSSALKMMEAYNKAILFFEQRKVILPVPGLVLLDTPGEVTPFSTELQEDSNVDVVMEETSPREEEIVPASTMKMEEESGMTQEQI